MKQQVMKSNLRQKGLRLCVRTDYLLGTDRSLFRNVSVRDPRHNTDHFMVVGCLRSALEREHTRYIAGRRKSTLRPPTEPTREDGIFAALRRAVPKTYWRDRHKNEWILEETWRLVEERVSSQRGTGVHAKIWRLGRTIRASLQGDRKRRVKTTGQEVETLLWEDPPKPKEAWRRLKGWYKAAVNRAPPPAQATLERITAERVDLYIYVPYLGENIPVTVTPILVPHLGGVLKNSLCRWSALHPIGIFFLQRKYLRLHLDLIPAMFLHHTTHTQPCLYHLSLFDKKFNCK